jgi:hypothetical protein
MYNWLQLVRTDFCRFQINIQICETATAATQKLAQPQPQKNRTAVQSSSVSVFFRFDEPDLQTLFLNINFPNEGLW